MKNKGKSDYTIKFVDKSLTYISKHANLKSPEEVETFIAQLKNKNGEDVSNGYQKNPSAVKTTPRARYYILIPKQRLPLELSIKGGDDEGVCHKRRI